jgi:hypothetical protein
VVTSPAIAGFPASGSELPWQRWGAAALALLRVGYPVLPAHGGAAAGTTLKIRLAACALRGPGASRWCWGPVAQIQRCEAPRDPKLHGTDGEMEAQMSK